GPYSVVRHPIYSGLLLAVLGTAVVVGEVRGLVAVTVAFLMWLVKSRTEERFLAEQFTRSTRSTGGRHGRSCRSSCEPSVVLHPVSCGPQVSPDAREMADVRRVYL